MPIEPVGLMTASLETAPLGGLVARSLAAAIRAVDPGEAVRRFVRRKGEDLWIGDKLYSLRKFRRVLVVGAGKAGAPMTRALAGILGPYLTEGLVIVKDGHLAVGSQVEVEDEARADASSALGRVQITEARHPLPDQRGVTATRRMVNMLEGAEAEDLVICLLSGGGSALMTSPIAGITLDDIQSLTALLLGSGATIQEINCLRKHLDEVKGGKLARIAEPAPLIALILSDVVGDPLDVIASGPTVPDPTSFADAFRILENYHLEDQTPPSILAYLHQGALGQAVDTPKPGDPAFTAVRNVIIGNNLLAAQAILETSRQAGLNTLLLTTYLQGEARYAGKMLAAVARQIEMNGQPLPRPACLVCGGETTVTLVGNGLGGRNQEVALGAVVDLAGLPNTILVTLATDGGDGPTDAAGAVVTGDTFARATALGLRPHDFLERNDAYHFFDSLGDLVKTDPTATNVNDLTCLFLA